MIAALSLYTFILLPHSILAADKDGDLLHRGITALNANDVPAALGVFQEALELAPTNATVWEAVGAAHSMAGDHNDAIMHYVRASALEPGSADRWYTVGHAFAAADRLNESEVSLRLAIDLAQPAEDDVIAAATRDLGVVLANQARPKEAEQMFTKATHHAPTDLEIPLKLGRLLAVLPERHGDAVDSLVSALRRSAARVNATSGEDTDAIEVRDRAVQELLSLVARMPRGVGPTAKKDRAPWNEQSHEPAMQHGFDKATKALEALTEVGPPRFAVVWELAQVYATSFRHQEAEEAYRQTLALNPSDLKVQLDAQFNTGVVVARLDRPSEAAALFRNVVQLRPDEVKAWEYLGDQLLRAGASEDAALAYQKAGEFYASMNASFRLLINFYSTEAAFWDRRAAETAALANAATSEALTSPFAHTLPNIMEKLRETELNTTWQVARLLECARVFGATESTKFTCGYGISWFDTAWQPIMAHPLVVRALDLARKTPDPRVVVLGSALGEHCIFTSLLTGIKCVGYDLLCETNVAFASGVLPKGSQAEFQCADAVEAAELSGAHLVWALDAVWPAELHRRMEQRLAAELPVGAVAVLYREPAWQSEDALKRHGDAVTIEVSWRRDLSVTLLEKLGSGSDELKRGEL